MNINKFKELDLILDDKFYKRCEQFISILQQWGKVHNLTAELEDYKIENNIIDSIYPLKFIDNVNSIADIGTGAGYPGMLLAIAKPSTKVYLIEPRAKRVAFLNFVKNSLQLENVEIICARVENVEDVKVDLITSRAVTNTALLLELTAKISNDNTSYLFYKGSMLEEELKEAKINKYEIVNVNDRNYLYINRGNN